MRRFVPLALILAVPALPAQSIFDSAIRAAPQYQQYHFGSPSGQTISELSVPVYVLFPITSSLSFDVGASYASVSESRTVGSTKSTSTISGPTDTQIRMNYDIGDFLVVTAGVSLPTGKSTATTQQLAAATIISSDFLAFPISSLGTGFGGVGGLGLVQPIGDWSIGIGASVRHSEAYDPYTLTTGEKLRYEPGDEYRGRFGLDHPFGTGHFTIGETYSRFGDDNIGGSIYNTGDRWITDLSVSNAVPGGDLLIAGWNLFRTSGTLSDGTITGRENVADLTLVYGIAALGGRIEPMVEGRYWTQADQSNSMLETVGLRFTHQFGSFGLSPSAGYTIGKLAAQTISGAQTTANLTGYKGQLTITFP